MMRNKLIIAGLAAIITNNSFAQHNLGLATSDYSALNSLYINPANIADSKEKVAVYLFSINAGVDNNLGTFSNLSNLGSSSNNAFNLPDNNNSFSALIPAMELRFPGIMVGLNDDHQQSFALTTRLRGINQFNNFSQNFYSTVSGSNRNSNQNYEYSTQNFNWTANVWSELALSYGIVAMNDGTNQVKAGVTLRYLGGIDYLSIKGKNLDVKYQAGSDSFYASRSDLEFASNVFNANNSYNNGISASDVLSQFFGSKAGGGLGMDIGGVWTYDPDGNEKDENDHHRLRVGAAVTDIGAIKYKAGTNFVAKVSGNGWVTGSGLSDSTGNYNDLRTYAMNHGYSVDTNSGATKVYMPTAMNVNVDYQIYHNVYVNALFLANLANRQNFGNSYYTQFTMTPRYDSKVLTVGLPITYSALAHDMKLGLGIRIGGLMLGSDDMLALMSAHQHGFDFYFGGYIPLYKKKKQETYNPR